MPSLKPACSQRLRCMYDLYFAWSFSVVWSTFLSSSLLQKGFGLLAFWLLAVYHKHNVVVGMPVNTPPCVCVRPLYMEFTRCVWIVCIGILCQGCGSSKHVCFLSVSLIGSSSNVFVCRVCLCSTLYYSSVPVYPTCLYICHLLKSTVLTISFTCCSGGVLSHWLLTYPLSG